MMAKEVNSLVLKILPRFTEVQVSTWLPQFLEMLQFPDLIELGGGFVDVFREKGRWDSDVKALNFL